MRYLVLVILLLLSGCSERIIYKTKTYYKPLPRELILDDVMLPLPPDKTLYINGTPVIREIMLKNLIIELYSTIYIYKIRIRDIKKYDENASKIYR